MKPYRTIPIRECGETLVAIPPAPFAFFDPPPYMALGAPYGGASPWMLRQGVLHALLEVQARLESQRPGWKIKLFDAYRPNAVQAFMVEHEFRLQATAAGLNPHALTTADRDILAPKVYRLWAIPSDDPATPPPHSTGAVIDCTLADETGREVDMGSPLDENSDRSKPGYFSGATDAAGKTAHAQRLLLQSLMQNAGFHQHPAEWWHFSKGDQMWAYSERVQGRNAEAVAVYGRTENRINYVFSKS